MERPAATPERLTGIAFVGIILAGGTNAVAIRLGNAELTPFLGATLRFGLASLILLAIMALRHSPLPRGRARLGVLLYGLTSFAGAYAALYTGLVNAPAVTAMVAIALVPLLTLLMAVAIGQETLTRRGVSGAIVALAGIGLIVSDQISGDVPIGSLVALFIGAVFLASSGVIVKRIPPGDPVAANGLGMAVGAAVLTALALLGGEPLVLPTQAQTWASVLYLAVIGSVALFMLVLYVLARWTASATAYATLAMPLVTVVLGALLLSEHVRPLFFVGAAVALAGIYLGVVRRPRIRKTSGAITDSSMP